MSRHKALVGTLVIANGQSDSSFLSSVLTAGQIKVLSGSVVALEITAPAALTATCTVMTVPTEGSTTWTTAAVNGGTTYALAAAQTTVIPISAFADLKIHSAGSEGAERSFIIWAQLDSGC